jgi:hypothetical protein
MNLNCLIELLNGGPAAFDASLKTLAQYGVFQRSDMKDQVAFALGVELLTRYLRWKSENGITIDFESDIQLLLKNERVREQLSANLFRHGEPTIWQLDTVLDLLVLASYSRHITVNQTIKRRSEGAAPSPPGFSKA